MTAFFAGVGRLVAAHPKRTVGICLAFAAISLVGLVRFRVETNGEKLYTPPNSQAFDDRNYVESVFGYEDLRSDLYATGSTSANLLTRAHLLSWFDALERVRGVTAVCDQGSCDGQQITYDSVAAKRNGIAELTSVLDYFGNNRTLVQELTDSAILDYVNNPNARNAVGQPVFVDDVMGGRTTDANGRTVAAKAFKAVLVLKNDKEEISGSPNMDPATNAWEEAFAKATVNTMQGDLELFPFSAAYEQSEQDEAINSDIGLLVIGYILLIVYVHIAFSRASWVRSRSNLAIWAVMSVILAIATVMGLVSAMGVNFNLVTQSLFLLLLGLGVDDALVITESFGDTPARGFDIKQRIATAVSRAGVSITVTSFTDIVAFGTGLMSSLPALQDFSVYAFVGIFLDFLFQLTFFVAGLTLDARRQERNRVDMLCCITREPQVPCCAVPCLASAAKPERMLRKDGSDTPSLATRLASEYLPRILLHPVGKVVVLALAVAMVGAGCYGATQVEQNFDIEWFTPDSSDLQKTYDVRDAYFMGQNMPVRVYTKQVDYFALQGQLGQLNAALAANKWVLPGSLRSWYSAYTDYLAAQGKSPLDSNTGGPANEADFYPWLREFLDSESGAGYVDDVVFTDTTRSQIRGTKTFMLYKELETASDMVDAMDSLRDLVGQWPQLDGVVYTFAFLFIEGFAVIQFETIRNVVSALVAVGVICLFLLADAVAAGLVVAMILAIDVCLVGSMFYFSLDYNSVTAINIVLAIGLSVDYSAHIARSFLAVKGESRQERAVKALEHIGGAVLNGAGSTFIAVFVLVASTSYIFFVFWLMWTLTIFLALFFGVCVLPILLSLIGPPPYQSATVDDHGENDVEAKGAGAAGLELKAFPGPGSKSPSSAVAPAPGSASVEV